MRSCLGTNERVLRVSGRLANVMRMVHILIDKNQDKLEPGHAMDHFDHKGVPRGLEVRNISVSC